MHIIDLRGVIAIAGGSLIWKIISSINSLGTTQDGRLEEVNAMMKEFQSGGTTHRMPPLKKSNLRLDGWAQLSGPIIKAANTRALLPFLEFLANKFFGAHGAYASSIRKVFSSLVQIQKIFYASGQFLEDDAKDQFKKAVLRLGRHWQQLRHLSSLENENPFQIRPKVHSNAFP